jgi:hypothetical protein
MTSRVSLSFTVILILCAAACVPGASGPGDGFPKKIVAALDGGPALPVTAAGETDGESYRELPKIALYPDEKLVQVLTTNLDVDEADEQVIIVRQVMIAAPLKLIIADTGSGGGGWERSYDTELDATDERTVRIHVADILGSNTLQIIVSGMDAADHATLDAFRIISAPGARLAYFPVCRFVSEGTIEIDESGSSGNSGEFRRGTSFPIIVYHGDPESPVANAVIRETYAYHYGAQAYVLQSRENVAAPQADDSLTAVLRNSTPESLKNFIKGIWHKTDEAVRTDEKILSFDPESEDISFFASDVQEVYKWKYSRRSLYNTLQIYTESALLKSVQPNITVVLISPNELSVAVTEYSTMEQWLNEQWGGTYTRLPEGRPGAAAEQATPLFEGEYVSPEAAVLDFSTPHFSWQDGKTKNEGGFTVMEFRHRESLDYVLSLKIIEGQGLIITDRFFIIKTKDVLKANVPLSSFTLLPARTSVYGIVDAKGQPLHFTRRPG